MTRLVGITRSPRNAVRGFVTMGNTHAVNPALPFAGSYCERFYAQPSQHAPFIANPKAPICRTCVTAMEAEVKGES